MAQIALLIGVPGPALDRAADRTIAHWMSDRLAVVAPAPEPSTWPFRFPLAPVLPVGEVALVARRIDRAFSATQTLGTKLVTTQAMYLLEEWLLALQAHGRARLVATASRDALLVHAPEVLARRGIFGRITLEEVSPESTDDSTSLAAPTDDDAKGNAERAPYDAADDAPAKALAVAFQAPDAEQRLHACVGALDAGRSAAALVATASACVEVNDLDAAARDLDEALLLAPGWAAAHFERGKVWLRRDDMEQASASFRRATTCLPGFGPAWANLGAALGELDRSDDALVAFERALVADPTSHQAINNIGVLSRELGRLPDSEAAFRQVIQLTPNLAFGYYNLGHTLFLQGRYHAALSAYADGQTRDADRNPVQATRLALCRLATGDAEGALQELQRATRTLPREYRQQLLADTSGITWALLTHRPDLPGWARVNDWLTAELAAIA